MAPFSIYHSLQKPDNYLNQTFFYIIRLFFSINIYGSVYFLTLISFDRYLGAVHPITSLTWWNKGKAMFCTAAVWIFIVLASVPEIFRTIEAGRQYDSKNSQDDIGGHLQFEVSFVLSKIVLRFLIPVTVIFTCYMLTLKALLQLCKRQQRKNRIIRPLLLISAAMIVFAVSFTPYHITMMVIIVYKTCCHRRKACVADRRTSLLSSKLPPGPAEACWLIRQQNSTWGCRHRPSRQLFH